MLNVTYCYPDSSIKTTRIINDRSLLCRFMRKIELGGGAIINVKNERKEAYLHNRAFYFVQLYKVNSNCATKVITAYGQLSCARICNWARDNGYMAALQRVRRNGSNYIPIDRIPQKISKNMINFKK